MIYRFLDLPELIRECIANNNQAWTEFINRYNNIVLRSIKYRFYLKEAKIPFSDVTEISQSFFVKLWQTKNLKKVQDSDNIDNWISMVATNFAIDHIRKLKKRSSLKRASFLHTHPIEDQNSDAINDLLFDKETSIQDDLDKKLAKDLLNKEIENLSTKEKIAVKLHIFHDMKYRDIKNITGIPKSSLGNLLNNTVMK